MIDERVADAIKAHQKKVDWRHEQIGVTDLEAPPKPLVAGKDASTFTPPNGMMKH